MSIFNSMNTDYQNMASPDYGQAKLNSELLSRIDQLEKKVAALAKHCHAKWVAAEVVPAHYVTVVPEIV